MNGVDYFVSDIHLAAERPRVSDLFLRFCDHASRDAKRIFLVGDIFDLWVGRKQEKLPYVVPILDRLRENLIKFKKTDLQEVMNRTVNETLSRTLMTSGTTLIASRPFARPSAPTWPSWSTSIRGSTLQKRLSVAT